MCERVQAVSDETCKRQHKTRTGFCFVTFSRDNLFGWGLFFWCGAHLPDSALGCTSNHCASLSAYSLPRSLTHSVLSACCRPGSAAHCSDVAVIRVAGRANGSGGYGRSACARATDALLATKVSIAAMRIPTAAAATLSSSAFCRDVDVVHCAHPRESPAKVTAPSGP